MEYRPFGRTGLKVSPLCLGAMMFGAWGNRDRDDSIRIIHETLGALTDLVRAGKIRYLGSSTFPPHAVVEAQWVAERRGRERFVCEQPPYSMLIREVERDVLPTCQHYGMGVIPWSPLAGGWLSGKW